MHKSRRPGESVKSLDRESTASTARRKERTRGSTLHVLNLQIAVVETRFRLYCRRFMFNVPDLQGK